MKYRLDTWYRGQDKHGNSIACLRLDLHTANTELRNKVSAAIRKAMSDPDPGPTEKTGAVGFGQPGPEDES